MARNVTMGFRYEVSCRIALKYVPEVRIIASSIFSILKNIAHIVCSNIITLKYFPGLVNNVQ